jgi:ATP-binding protein involved in chromosome partitioning
MSYLENPENGEKNFIFGQGGGEKTSQDLDTKLLGQVPLDQNVREGGDHGIPVVISHSECRASLAFKGYCFQINGRSQINQLLISRCRVCFLRKRLYFFFSTGSVCSFLFRVDM